MTDGFFKNADGSAHGVDGHALLGAAFVTRLPHLGGDDLEIVAQRLKIRRGRVTGRWISRRRRDGNGRQQDRDEGQDEGKGAAPDRKSHGARVAAFMGNLTSASSARFNLDAVNVEALAWLITTATCARP